MNSPVEPAPQGAPNTGEAEGTPKTDVTALHEHDNALAKREVQRDSGSDEKEPQPTAETQPRTASASADDVATRENGSSGEYVDATTGSQPAVLQADTSTERPP